MTWLYKLLWNLFLSCTEVIQLFLPKTSRIIYQRIEHCDIIKGRTTPRAITRRVNPENRNYVNATLNFPIIAVGCVGVGVSTANKTAEPCSEQYEELVYRNACIDKILLVNRLIDLFRVIETDQVSAIKE